MRDYFDAGVERVTVDDVFARARVTQGGMERLHTRRVRLGLRPAWAAAGAFAATLLIIGGFAALLKAAPEIADVDVGSAEIVEPNGGTLGIWIIAALAAAVVAGMTVWIIRRRSNGTGADDPDDEPGQGRVMVMDTIERTEKGPEVTEHRSRWPMVVIVVLAVALVAALLWMVLAMRPNSPNAAPPEIVEFMEEYTAAWNAHDADALVPIVTVDYRIHSQVPGFDYGIDEVEFYVMPLLDDWDWSTTNAGPFYAVDLGGLRWAVSSEGSTITRDGTELPTSGLWLLVKSEDGFKVAEHYFFGG